MALDYISDRITREMFYEKIYAKSGSKVSVETAKTHLSNLDYFCQDYYNRETITILADLREDMERSHSPTKVLRFLDEFVKWLLLDHPNIQYTIGRGKKAVRFLRKKNNNSIPVYFATIRKYLSQVGGIRLHDDDIKMDVTKPKVSSGNYENEESEPLTAKQARDVIELTTDQRSITLYHTMNDTGFRISEAGQIKEKRINFEKNPVEVFLPQENSKGKTSGGTRFVRSETAKRLKLLCKEEPEKFVFRITPTQDVIHFRHNELRKIRKIYDAIGLDQTYENSGRHKFNLHSWRKRCATEYARSNGEELSHGYIRHRKHLAMYIIKTKEERIFYFKRAVMDLAIDEIEKSEIALDKKDKELLDMRKASKEVARETLHEMFNGMSIKQMEAVLDKKKSKVN